MFEEAQPANVIIGETVPLTSTWVGRAPRSRPVRALDAAIQFLVFSLLMCAPAAMGAVLPGAILGIELTAALLFLLWVLRQAVAGSMTARPHPLYAPALLFGAVVASQLATHHTAIYTATLTEALLYVAYALVAFVVTQTLCGHNDLSRFMLVLGIYGFVVAVYSIVQGFASPYLIYWKIHPAVGNIYGPYVNHNHYAGLMELLAAIPLVLSLDRHLPGSQRALSAFAALVCGISVVLSGSRTGMLSFGLEVLFAIALTASSRRRAGAVAAGFVLAIVVAGIALGGRPVVERIGTVRSGHDTAVISRWLILQDSLRMVPSHPLLGWGLGTFPDTYPRFRTFYSSVFINEAHNDYVQLLVETGVAGFAAMLWFLVALFRRGLRNIARRPHTIGNVAIATLTGCVGLLVHSFADFNLHIPANALMFFVFCGIAACPLELRRPSSS